MFLTNILLLLQLLSLAKTSSSTNTPDQASSSPTALPPASQHIYTGFSYGAFWSESEPKRYKDFHRQFTLAKNLPNVPIPFTSARLYQAAQWGSPQEPSEAFQAAIDTNTTVLIGLWLPIDNELIALDKAFEKHGQKLVDLVIGIVVGNEDIYRDSEDCSRKQGAKCSMAATAEEVMSNITRVKAWMQSKSWFALFRTPPLIGHADTTRNAALSNADFIGANIFPFWHPDPIDKAWESFEESLLDVKQRVGNTPVWITETGWPSSGNDSTASVENMQRYWRDVGCEVLGRYTTFWFELERDTQDVGGLDWGIVDIERQELKIKELGCSGKPAKSLTSEDAAERRAISVPTLSESLSHTTASISVPTLSHSPSHTTSISIPILSNSPSHTASSISPLPTTDQTTTLTTVVTAHLPLPSTITLLRKTTLAPNRTLHLVHKTITSFITLSPNTTLSSNTSPPSNTTLSKTPLSKTPLSKPPFSNSALSSSLSTNTPFSNSTLNSIPHTTHTTHITLTPTVTVPPTSHPVTNTTILSPPPSSRPTVWITIPTGCITLSRDENGNTVTMSNLPVSGRCSVPAYTPPGGKGMGMGKGKEVGVKEREA